MGVVNSLLRSIEINEDVKEDVEEYVKEDIKEDVKEKEISIKQQITIEKDKIYNNRDTIYKSIIKNKYIDCYCGCKYNKIFTKLKQKDVVDDYTLVVVGNIDMIYNEVIKIEDAYRMGIHKEFKKCENTYLHNLKNIYYGCNNIIKNVIHLHTRSIINEIDIYDSDYKTLIIIKDSGIKHLPIIINKKDEDILRSKGIIGDVIQECLTAKKLLKKLLLENNINKDYNENSKTNENSKKRKREIEKLDILPNKKSIVKSSNEKDIVKYLKSNMSSCCLCSCVNTITNEDIESATILVEGYRKKIIDNFMEYLNFIHIIGKKCENPGLLHIVSNNCDDYKDEDDSISIYSACYIMDYYTYIDDEIIPIVINIKDEEDLRRMGYIRNIIKDSKCSRLLLKKL